MIKKSIVLSICASLIFLSFKGCADAEHIADEIIEDACISCNNAIFEMVEFMKRGCLIVSSSISANATAQGLFNEISRHCEHSALSIVGVIGETCFLKEEPAYAGDCDSIPMASLSLPLKITNALGPGDPVTLVVVIGFVASVDNVFSFTIDPDGDSYIETILPELLYAEGMEITAAVADLETNEVLAANSIEFTFNRVNYQQRREIEVFRISHPDGDGGFVDEYKLNFWNW